MNVKSKDFWLKVKEEYQPKANHYLCHNSNSFNLAWNNNLTRKEIKEEAELFCVDKDLNVGSRVLFYTRFFGKKPKIQIRKQFIDHMINKYS